MNLRSFGPARKGTLYPLLVLLVSLPVVAYALRGSTAWVGRVFPGCFVLPNRVISNVQAHDWMLDAPTIPLHQIVAVDAHPVSSSREVYDLVAAKPAGTEIEYELRDGDHHLRVRLASRRFSQSDFFETFGVLLLFGCASLATALVVGFLQPGSTEARVYLLSGFVAGLYPVCGTFLYHADAPWPLTTAYMIAEPLFPATWIHLALVFPVARPASGRRRWALPAAYTVSALLALALFVGFYRDPPNLTAAKLTWVYIAFAIVFFFGRMFRQRHHADARVRARANATFVWLVLATIPALIVFAVNALLRRSLPQQFGLVLAPVFYASIAYSIAKHDLFDVNRLVRRSFAYGLLTSLVSAGYFATLATADAILGSEGVLLQRFFGTAFVLLLAIAFDPLRRVVQNFVDRAFYRTPLDYRATLSSIAAILTTKLDETEIVEAVTTVLTRDVLLESAAVFLVEPSPRLWRRTSSGTLERQESGSAVPALHRLIGDTQNGGELSSLLGRADASEASEAVRAFVETGTARIALPLLFLGKSTGLLLLGAKLSGRNLDSEDLQLLRTLADQMAIALHNAASYAALEESRRTLDEKVQQQTKDLRDSYAALERSKQAIEDAQRQLVQQEKMASLGQLVAGAAHELNNPVSHVHGSLENLEDFVDGFVEVLRAYEQAPIADPAAAQAVEAAKRRRRLPYLLKATPTLLRVCREGSERVRHIVEDLRMFSRADHGALQSVDVIQGIEAALRTLEARISSAAVVVERMYDEVPAIEGRADELIQVWTNLLANALDSMSGRAQARIAIGVRAYQPAAGGEAVGVEVTVRDTGGGIPPEIRERIYDPFFTTKAIGAGTGLGLSIVHGIVQQHRGTIDCGSTPGVGTTFTVRLPHKA